MSEDNTTRKALTDLFLSPGDNLGDWVFRPLLRHRRVSARRRLPFFRSLSSLSHGSCATMLLSKKKYRPPFALSFKARRLICSAKRAALAKKRIKSISLVDLPEIGVAVSGSMILGKDLSLLAPIPGGSPLVASGPSGSIQSATVASPVTPSASGLVLMKDVSASTQSSSPPASEAQALSKGSHPVHSTVAKTADVMNYANLLKSSAQLQKIGSPVEHISGAPFVLIPDENIEAAKLEFKDFIYARFHGDYPSMGKIIGIVNAVWARTGPRIFVHNIGQGIYLFRVPNPRTREVLLARTCWNIGGLPMFVAPWAPDYSPDEPPLTNAIIPVEMRNVPYLLFNKESLSRIATAVGKPESLAPETERKENFEVAKLFVRVDLTAPLPNKIISGFSNGREVEIDVSYPWLPVKCELCKKFGHKSSKCTEGLVEGVAVKVHRKVSPPEATRRRSKSRTGRSTEKRIQQGLLRYIPMVRTSTEDSKSTQSAEGPDNSREITPPAPSIQDIPPADLEDGEICPSALEDSTATQRDDVENPQPTGGKQSMLEAQLTVSADCDGATADGSNQVPAEVRIEKTTDPGGMRVNLISLSPEELVQSSPDTVEGLSEVVVHASPVTDEVPPEALSFVEEYRPVEEDEQDNPFILVKNRKSSRKAAKRH